MKRMFGITLVCMLLTGCGVVHNAVLASQPNNPPTNKTIEHTITTTMQPLPTPPLGFDWDQVIVNHKTYQFLAKSEDDTHHDGLLADTKYGVAWTNPTNPKQILLSPPGTTVLDPAKAKAIYTFTLPKGMDKTVYAGSAGGFDMSPDSPDYLFWSASVFKKSDPMVRTMDIHALNLKTGVDRVVVKNERIGGGDEFSVAYHSHYFFYNQETPTASSIEAHVHEVDLNTGRDRLIWVGDSAKLPAVKVTLDDGTYTPVWTAYGTRVSFP